MTPPKKDLHGPWSAAGASSALRHNHSERPSTKTPRRLSSPGAPWTQNWLVPWEKLGKIWPRCGTSMVSGEKLYNYGVEHVWLPQAWITVMIGWVTSIQTFADWTIRCFADEECLGRWWTRLNWGMCQPCCLGSKVKWKTTALTAPIHVFSNNPTWEWTIHQLESFIPSGNQTWQ